jgi:hypothetical protein
LKSVIPINAINNAWPLDIMSFVSLQMNLITNNSCLTDDSGSSSGVFSEEKNRLIALAINIQHMEVSITFVRLTWFKIYSFIKYNLAENVKETKFMNAITKE